MFFGLYDPATGVIRKCLSGPSAEWAALNANDGEMVIKSEAAIDNSRQAVDIAVDPHELVGLVYVPSQAELAVTIMRAAQGRLDAFAQTRGYDGIMSAATYATSRVPKFSAEGRQAVDLRDATWAKLYEMLDEIKAGTRLIPARFEDIEGELPALKWSQ